MNDASPSRMIRLGYDLRYRIQNKLSQLGFPDYTILTIFSILTGIVAGIAAVTFHDSVEFIHHFFFEFLTNQLIDTGGWVIVLIPALGMLLQSLMRYAAPVTARKRGVMEVIKAVAMRGGHIPFRTTLFHFLAPVICIGTGGTVGPEGPIAQLGGGVASKMGGLFGLTESRRRMLTAAGAGAAIAAVFNTPLGGIFFALEVILLNDFRSPTFSALILASVAASAISRVFLGNTATFVFSSVEIGPYPQLYLYAVLGIAAGVLSLLYLRYSRLAARIFKKHILRRLPLWLVMSLVGVLVGLCGYFYPGILGVGYRAMNHILSNSLTWQTVAILFLMKFILVPLILSSGGFGGIFAPSLFMGACLGYLFSLVLSSVFGLQIDSTAYILVGMGAVLGGINSIPISAILIIFEMTREYSFILPLMLGVVTTTTIVQLVVGGSVYSRNLEQEGYKITHGRDSNILRTLTVRNVMRDDVVLIPEHLPLPELISNLVESPHSTFYTVNTSGKIVGTIPESELRPIITDYQHLREMLVARDIARPGSVVVSENENLDDVLRRFAKEGVDEFPVVAAEDANRVIGSVTQQDVIAAYNRESLKYNLVDGVASDLKTVSRHHPVQVGQGFMIAERTVPRKFIGRTLSQLRLRNKYNIEVLMIRPAQSSLAEEEVRDFVVPTPDYQLQAGDVLVVFGKDEAVIQTARW